MRGPFYFCGVGGAGMSPLARLLAARGAVVLGSDRSCDAGRNTPFFSQLQREGIRLLPQDGSGVTAEIATFVVTRAVEDSIPDIRRAQELGLSVVRRPELMANVFSATRNVAVAGTSGKSTTTGMLGFVLDRLGVNPTILNGAEMIDFDSSFRAGGERAVFEADESDGLNDVVGLCSTEVAVLTNISLDHFELPELERIFGAFISRATGGVVLNADCPVSMKLRGLARQHITFAASGGAADITPRELGGPLAIRGEHNVANALATLGAVKLLGLDRAQAAEALRSFRGMRRRLELIGEASGIKVFDDFASNPGKIRATLETLRGEGTRLIVIFQPHGFQPTKMMLNGYIDTFAECLRKDDRLFVPAIYYAGGSANLVEGKVVELPSDISGRDIVTGVTARGINARYVENRVDVVRSVAETVHAGDVVVSMGSRDETLPEFARSLYDGLTDI